MEIDITFESFAPLMKAHSFALAKAGPKTIRYVANSSKNALKRATVAAGLDQKGAGGISDSWHAEHFPKRGPAVEPASLISSTFKHMNSHTEGVTIRAQGGKYLAIPTVHVGRKGNFQKLEPKDYGNKLQFVKGNDEHHAMLVMKDGLFGNKVKLMFVLQKQVRITKKFDVDDIVNTFMAKAADKHGRELEKAQRELGLME